MPTARSARRWRSREKLDTGIYAHQVRAAPANRTVILVTRGNNAGAGKPEDPGAIKTFRFDNGVLTNLASIAPGNGARLRPAPSRFSSDASRGPSSRSSGRTSSTSTGSTTRPALARDPMFIKETLSDPATQGARKAPAPIHVHPERQVRLSDQPHVSGVGSRRRENVAPAARTASPSSPSTETTRRADADPEHRRPRRAAAHLRHRSERPHSGRRQHHARLDGRHAAGRHHGVCASAATASSRFVRKYDVDVGNAQQFWSGMVTLRLTVIPREVAIRSAPRYQACAFLLRSDGSHLCCRSI